MGTVCGVVSLVSAVCGVRGWGSVSACLWNVSGFVRGLLAPRRFLVPACGVGVRAGPGSRLCPALRGWVFGVCFLCLFFLGVPVPGLVVPVPPSPFFRAGLLALFFFRGVYLHDSVSLFPLGRCQFLPLPSLVGARTGPHSVLSSGLLLAVAFCLAVFRPHGSGGLCTRWARHPFLPG